MRHFGIFLSGFMLAALCAVACTDLSPIEEEIRDLQDRMSKVEKMCQGYNSSIEALQTALKALSEEDYVVSASPVKEGDEILGYSLVFKSGASAFIRCGFDGKDGANGKDGVDGKDGEAGKDGAPGKDGINGKDGQDGHTPVIGVKQDTDGIWYWTVDGQWLLNDGQKVPAVGHDGKDGVDGKDGTDGKDGYTPELGMAQDTDGIWYWTVDGQWLLNNGQKVPAVGRDGQDGTDGVDGQDGHTPEIGMAQDEDGVWYWTIDGQWLLNDGQKVPAVGRDGKDGVDGKDGQDGKDGKDGVTPKLKVEAGYWWVSYNGGVSWSQICAYVEGSSSSSVFSAIDLSSEDYITLTLTGGGSITLPRYKAMSISFSPSASVKVIAGKSASVAYTLTSTSDKAIVKALGQNGWSAKVEKTNSSSGTITITASESAETVSEIIVLVNDTDRTILSSISCTLDVPLPLFVDVDAPGCYSISGYDLTGTIYVPSEYDQKSLKTVSSGVMYRMTSLQEARTVSVSFSSTSLNVGASGTVKVSSEGIDDIVNGSFQGSISKKDGNMVWLSDNNGHGYVIETE